MIRRIWMDDAGQDVPEYALMLALILVITIGVVSGIGNDASTIFTNVKTAMDSAIATAS
jgi:Flp pilus assembly pilin Flp